MGTLHCKLAGYAPGGRGAGTAEAMMGLPIEELYSASGKRECLHAHQAGDFTQTNRLEFRTSRHLVDISCKAWSSTPIANLNDMPGSGKRAGINAGEILVARDGGNDQAVVVS